MKKVYAFFANGFEEIEALTPVDVLRRAGAQVVTVSVTGDKLVCSAHQVPVLCDALLEDCNLADADLLFLPGGMPGAQTLSETEGLRQAVLHQAAQGKTVAAICAAPMALGKWGLLKGKKATCYPGFEGFLEGADYTAMPVEQDGEIITGRGPGASMPFALTLAAHFYGEAKAEELKQGMCVAF